MSVFGNSYGGEGSVRISKLFKQRNIRWIGPFIDVLYLTMPLFGMISYCMMAITMYAVVRGYLLAALPWIKIWMFFLFLVVTCLCLLLIVYKFIYPSYFTFRNKQEYLHNNLLRQHLERQDKELKKIKDKLGVDG